MISTVLLATVPRLDERGLPVGQWGSEEWQMAWLVVGIVGLMIGIAVWRERRRVEAILGAEAEIMVAPMLPKALVPRLIGAVVLMGLAGFLLLETLGRPAYPHPAFLLPDLFRILASAGLIMVTASLAAPLMVTMRRIVVTPTHLYLQMVGAEELVEWSSVQRVELVWNTRRELQGIRILRLPSTGRGVDLTELPGIRQVFRLLGHKPVIRPVQAVFRPAQLSESVPVQQLEHRLRAVGVVVENRYMLLDSESHAPPLRLLTDFVIGLATFGTGLLLGLLTCFWIQWMTSGDLSGWAGLFGWGLLLGLVYTGMLLIAGPLRGWLWKSVEFLRRPRQRFNVEMGEDGLRTDPMACRVVPAVLEADEDSLLFQFDDRRLRIRRRDLVEVAIDESISVGTAFRWRYVATPIRVRWLTEEAAEHSILLHACNRSSLTADRRATDHLYIHLCRWRDGEPLDLSPVERVTRLRAVPALVLLLAGILTIPALHNHFVLTRIRTGEWRPAAVTPMRQETLTRVGAPLEAVDPTAVVLREEPRGFLGLARWWRLDLRSMSYRFLCYADGLVVPRPGNPTVAAVVSQRHWVNLLATVQSPRLPAQLVPTDGTLPIDAPWIPEGDLQPWRQAMHAGGILLQANPLPSSGRLHLPSPSQFIAHSSLFEFVLRGELINPSLKPADASLAVKPPDPVPLQRHAIHVYTPGGLSGDRRGEVEGLGPPQPTFFPGGRHALIHWQVMDLATGSHVAVRLPEPLTADMPWLSRGSSLFADGENLGLRVCADLDGVLINEVWSITREGNVMLLAILGTNEFLMSVDGNRWLLGALDDASGVALLLFDASSGIRQPLFRGSHLMNYSLVSGHDRLIEQHVRGGPVRVLDFGGRGAGLVDGEE